MSGASLKASLPRFVAVRIVLLNDTTEVWKAGVLGGYKDRSVSIFL